MSELRKSVKEGLEEVEKELRKVVDKTMQNKKGLQWIETDSGLTEESIENIKRIREDEWGKGKKPPPSNNLIDYTYPYHLKTIIEKNWNVFKPVLGDDRKKFNVLFDILIDNRNALAHPRHLEEYAYYLIIGASKFFIYHIQSWNKGFRRIIRYCSEIFFFTMGKPAAEEIEDQINTWISKINCANIKSDSRSKELSFEQGKVLITILEKTMEYAYMARKRELKTAFCKSVSIQSSNQQLLLELIEQSKRSVHRLEIFLDDVLDLAIINNNMISNGAKFHSDYNSDNIITNISYLVYESDPFKWPLRYLRFKLNNVNNNGVIIIEFEGNVDEGLSNLSLVNPTVIFDYLYGNLKFKEKKELIENITSFNNENDDHSMIRYTSFSHNEIK